MSFHTLKCGPDAEHSDWFIVAAVQLVVTLQFLYLGCPSEQKTIMCFCRYHYFFASVSNVQLLIHLFLTETQLTSFLRNLRAECIWAASTKVPEPHTILHSNFKPTVSIEGYMFFSLYFHKNGQVGWFVAS